MKLSSLVMLIVLLLVLFFGLGRLFSNYSWVGLGLFIVFVILFVTWLMGGWGGRRLGPTDTPPSPED